MVLALQADADISSGPKDTVPKLYEQAIVGVDIASSSAGDATTSFLRAARLASAEALKADKRMKLKIRDIATAASDLLEQRAGKRLGSCLA
jgi:hypothetical protein